MAPIVFATLAGCDPSIEPGVASRDALSDTLDTPAILDGAPDRAADVALPSDAQCIPNTVRPCFSGSPEQNGVGVCHEGLQFCFSGRWYNCEGERLPSQEICDGVDNDCNGTVDDGPDHLCVIGACREMVPFCRACMSLRQRSEVCDGRDNNCDGMVDGPEADPSCRFTDDPHRADHCTGGRCVQAPPGVCEPGWAMCPGGTTCSTNLRASPDDCGRCGNRCASRVCREGRCVTPSRLDFVGWGLGIATQGGPPVLCGPTQVQAIPMVDGLFRCGMAPPLGEVVAYVGTGNGCAVRRDGRVTCGRVHAEVLAPFDVPGVLNAIDARPGDITGHGATIILRASGEVAELRGIPGSPPTVVPVALFPEAVRLFPANYPNVCFGTREGNVECYRVMPGMAPRRLELPPDTVALSFDDSSFSCALLRSGRVSCWGMLFFGWGGIPSVPLPGLDMGLSGIRQITTNAVAGCATQGIGGGTWCWGHVGELIEMPRGSAPRQMGFPSTRVRDFDDMVFITLKSERDYQRPQLLAGITARHAVVCRGDNSYRHCGGSPSDILPRTVVWGEE